MSLAKILRGKSCPPPPPGDSPAWEDPLKQDAEVQGEKQLGCVR